LDARIADVYHAFSPSHEVLKNLYGEFYQWLLEKFDEWDPQGIFIEPRQGEYGPEVARIIPLLRTSKSAYELADHIHAIFVRMFDADIAGPIETDRPFAVEIIAEWQKQRGAIGPA
jgi:hypothetical protein